MANILCFGDSITFGFSDPEGGWAQRLSNYLGNIYVSEVGNHLHSVYNLGIDGDTSAGVLKRIKSEIAPRSYDDLVFIFFIGVNDSIYFEDGRVESEPDEYGRNLEKIVDIASKFSEKIMIIGTLPCDEGLMQPMQGAMEKGVSYSNSRLRQFNDVAEKISGRKNVLFEDIFSDFEKLDTDKFLFDGSHPNAVGHQYIADRIKKKVAEMANDYK